MYPRMHRYPPSTPSLRPSTTSPVMETSSPVQPPHDPRLVQHYDQILQDQIYARERQFTEELARHEAVWQVQQDEALHKQAAMQAQLEELMSRLAGANLHPPSSALP